MNNQIEFDINPFPAPRMTHSDKWKKRKCVVDYFRNRYNLKKLAETNGFKLPQSYCVWFNIEMPKSWSLEKKKEMNCTFHQQTPDIDNLLKAFQDSLTEDDSYVHTVRASKMWREHGSIFVSWDN